MNEKKENNNLNSIKESKNQKLINTNDINKKVLNKNSIRKQKRLFQMQKRIALLNEEELSELNNVQNEIINNLKKSFQKFTENKQNKFTKNRNSISLNFDNNENINDDNINNQNNNFEKEKEFINVDNNIIEKNIEIKNKDKEIKKLEKLVNKEEELSLKKRNTNPTTNDEDKSSSEAILYNEFGQNQKKNQNDFIQAFGFTKIVNDDINKNINNFSRNNKNMNINKEKEDNINIDKLNSKEFISVHLTNNENDNLIHNLDNFDFYNIVNYNNNDNKNENCNNNNEEDNVEINISNLEIDIDQLNNDSNYIKNENELIMSGENSNEFAKKYLSSKSKSFIKFNNNLTARVAAHNLQNSPSYMLALCPELLENFDKKNIIYDNYAVTDAISEEIESDTFIPRQSKKFVYSINKNVNDNNNKSLNNKEYKINNTLRNKDINKINIGFLFENKVNKEQITQKCCNKYKNKINKNRIKEIKDIDIYIDLKNVNNKKIMEKSLSTPINDNNFFFNINNINNNNNNKNNNKNNNIKNNNNINNNNNSNKNNNIKNNNNINNNNSSLKNNYNKKNNNNHNNSSNKNKSIKNNNNINIKINNNNNIIHNHNHNHDETRIKNGILKNSHKNIKSTNDTLKIKIRHQKAKSLINNSQIASLYLSGNIKNKNHSPKQVSFKLFDKEKKIHKIILINHKNKLLYNKKKKYSNDNYLSSHSHSNKKNNKNNSNKMIINNLKFNKSEKRTTKIESKIKFSNLKKSSAKGLSKSNSYKNNYLKNKKVLFTEKTNKSKSFINFISHIKKKNPLNLNIKIEQNINYAKKINQQICYGHKLFMNSLNYNSNRNNNKRLKEINKKTIGLNNCNIIKSTPLSKNFSFNKNKNNNNIKNTNNNSITWVKKNSAHKDNRDKKHFYITPNHKKSKTTFISPSYLNINKNKNKLYNKFDINNNKVSNNNNDKYKTIKKYVPKNNTKFNEIKKNVNDSSVKIIHKKTNTIGNSNDLTKLLNNNLNNGYNKQLKGSASNNNLKKNFNKHKIIMALQHLKFISKENYSRALNELYKSKKNLFIILVYTDSIKRYIFRGLYEVNSTDKKSANKIFAPGYGQNIITINSLNSFFNYQSNNGEFIRTKFNNDNDKKFGSDTIIVY